MYREVILQDLNALSISSVYTSHEGNSVEENKDYVVYEIFTDQLVREG
jgi:hypothetical protein